MRVVRRAYAICELFGTIQRVLVDETYDKDRPLIFYPGNAWMSGPRQRERLVFMPGQMVMNDWWDGWWGKNWRTCPDWVWCYGMAPKGRVPGIHLRG